MMTAALGKKVQLVGDDIFVTNKVRLQRGIEGMRYLEETEKRGILSPGFDSKL